jgi:hypothetical protein
MNAVINKLVQTVLQKNSLEDCNVEELQRLSVEYPYSASIQILYAKKLQAKDAELFRDQLNKTALLFNNPLWLDHLMNDDKGSAEIIEAKKTEAIPGMEEPVKMDAPLVPVSEEKKEPLTSTIKEEPVPSNSELAFEPYHTVDYFASQGIKFKEEEKPKDKFGQQLKSFTEWLKTMKRFPASEIVAASPNMEQKVEQLAEVSLKDREVITEAMAEVWLKQGSREKAIDIYNKLSLLDPSKSRYFAAKIEEIKKTN